MQIQSINNISFDAKIKPGTSGGAVNKSLHELFERKTKDFQGLELVQEKLNFTGKDYFYLTDGKEKLASKEAHHSCYSYCCLEEYVDEFVKIFNDLLKQAKISGKPV